MGELEGEKEVKEEVKNPEESAPQFTEEQIREASKVSKNFELSVNNNEYMLLKCRHCGKDAKMQLKDLYKKYKNDNKDKYTMVHSCEKEQLDFLVYAHRAGYMSLDIRRFSGNLGSAADTKKSLA